MQSNRCRSLKTEAVLNDFEPCQEVRTKVGGMEKEGMGKEGMGKERMGKEGMGKEGMEKEENGSLAACCRWLCAPDTVCCASPCGRASVKRGAAPP